MNETTTIKLTALSGPLEGETFSFSQKEITLGREESNDIKLANDRNVSRQHCRIFEHNKAIWLEDVGSSNGTILTHPGLSPQPLEPGNSSIVFEHTRFQIGTSQFEISGLSDYQHQALGTVGFQFQELMSDLCRLLPDFSPSQRKSYRAALEQLERHVKEARSETELLNYLQNDIAALSSAFLSNDGDLDQTIVFDPSLSLPPIPDELHEGDQEEAWITSIRNIFITDIRRCLKPEKDQEN